MQRVVKVGRQRREKKKKKWNVRYDRARSDQRSMGSSSSRGRRSPRSVHPPRTLTIVKKDQLICTVLLYPLFLLTVGTDPHHRQKGSTHMYSTTVPIISAYRWMTCVWDADPLHYYTVGDVELDSHVRGVVLQRTRFPVYIVCRWSQPRVWIFYCTI
jgi:hypothetical protein